MQHMEADKLVFGSLSENSEVEMSFSMAKFIFALEKLRFIQALYKMLGFEFAN